MLGDGDARLELIVDWKINLLGYKFVDIPDFVGVQKEGRGEGSHPLVEEVAVEYCVKVRVL